MTIKFKPRKPNGEFLPELEATQVGQFTAVHKTPGKRGWQISHIPTGVGMVPPAALRMITQQRKPLTKAQAIKFAKAMETGCAEIPQFQSTDVSVVQCIVKEIAEAAESALDNPGR